MGVGREPAVARNFQFQLDPDGGGVGELTPTFTEVASEGREKIHQLSLNKNALNALSSLQTRHAHNNLDALLEPQ